MAAAREMVEATGLVAQVLVDGVDDALSTALALHPLRWLAIDTQRATLSFIAQPTQGDVGPPTHGVVRGYDVAEFRAFIQAAGGVVQPTTTATTTTTTTL
mmetsp:Transcript_22858/g.54027  ORF Transcript_22858/g.54027 Transcript_22858/m.54027 type:complete len:100 (+) Transcript_22858:635-934(+)